MTVLSAGQLIGPGEAGAAGGCVPSLNEQPKHRTRRVRVVERGERSNAVTLRDHILNVQPAQGSEDGSLRSARRASVTTRAAK